MLGSSADFTELLLRRRIVAVAEDSALSLHSRHAYFKVTISGNVFKFLLVARIGVDSSAKSPL